MRIGFVTDNYKPYVSGVINFIELSRRYLQQHGHEAWVFAFGNPEDAPSEPRVVLSPGVKVRGTAGFRLGARLTRDVRRMIATMDVVHVDDPFVAGRLALRVCRKHHIPVVFTFHSRVDLYPDYFLKALPAGSVDVALRRYVRRFCRRVDTVISPTASVAQVMRDLGVDVPIKVMRNGVDIAPFLVAAGESERDGESREAKRRELGIEHNSIVFGYSGRLSPEKNLPLLVDAFAAAACRIPNANLLLIGDGPLRRTIEHAVADAGLSQRVSITGMVAYEQMPAHLALCDIWVTASVTEVDPLTVIEAMASGLPVIGPAAPGLTDTIVHGVTGLLAPANDSGALAERMIELAADTGMRHAMSAASAKASEQYSIDVRGAEMLDVYEQLVRKARSIRGSHSQIVLSGAPATPQERSQVAHDHVLAGVRTDERVEDPQQVRRRWVD